MGELKHASDCQSHIVDVRGRPDECTCGADTRPRTEGRGEALGRIEACIDDIKSGICCPRAQGCEQNDGELCLVRQAFARAGLIAPSPQDIQGEA